MELKDFLSMKKVKDVSTVDLEVSSLREAIESGDGSRIAAAALSVVRSLKTEKDLERVPEDLLPLVKSKAEWADQNPRDEKEQEA